MPFIDVRLSCELTTEKEEALKKEFGRLISTIPGKSESSLMLQFSDKCHLWFRGACDKSIAMVNLMLYGKSTSETYATLSKDIIALLNQELDIEPTQIFIKFEEVPNWFWA